MPRVSVVIPNWNGMTHLPTCLLALSEQTYGDFETIVADNGSTDTSRSYIRRHWPVVRIEELGSNKGFPAAVNAGIAAGAGEYVVLLNNDTRVAPDWLQRLVAAMDASPSYAWGSSKLLRFDEPGLIDSAGHAYSLWVGAARNIGEGEPATRFDRPVRIFGATAAASIYRRTLFDDIGLFDEEFFFIHEDTDLDLRANMAGYRCVLIPDAVVYHHRGASYEVAREIHLMGVRNRIWTTRSLPPLALFIWFVTKVLRAFRWFPARITGRRTSKRAAPSAWRDVSPVEVARATIGALKTLPGKRKQVRETRRLSSIQLLRLLSETKPRLDASSNQ